MLDERLRISIDQYRQVLNHAKQLEQLLPKGEPEELREYTRQLQDLQREAGLHDRELLEDLVTAAANQAAISFELGFTRASQADTALLPLQVGPAPDQARRHMLQLGQFDLQFTLMGAGPLGKNVQDQS